MQELRHYEIYPLGITVFKQEYRNVRVRHYTNHGNPKRCTNPHDHEIVWHPDSTFSYKPPINYYGDKDAIAGFYSEV